MYLSDNAKTFKAGAQELQTIKNQVLKPNASQQFLANHNITWKFITERGGEDSTKDLLV